jgi:hypothetical protein
VADDTNNNESITEIISKRLGQYLVEEIGSLKEYYAEFPQSNRDLKMPSVSIIAATSDFRPITPYPCEEVNPADIVNNKTLFKWAVGIYDFSIQLDIWARNKEERDDLFDATFNAMNPNITPMGLSLVMDEYFDQRVEYLYTKHDFPDGELNSQTDEWRATLTLLATCKAVRTRREFIITDVPTAQEIENASGLVNGEPDQSEISPTVIVVKP